MLNGEVNGPRVQSVTCYKFKMDWIRFRLIQFAKCIFHAQRVLVDDGIVDEDTVDTLLDLFAPTMAVYDATVAAIKDIDCVCDDLPYEEARILKLQETCEQESKVTRMLRTCKIATKTLVDDLKVFLAQLDHD